MVTFFSRERERIVKYLMDNPTKNIRVRELAKALRISPAHVSRSLKLLRKDRVIMDNKVNLSNPYTRALKILFNVKKLVDTGITEIFRRSGVSGAGVYGSWATGTNYEDSDLDIWIKVNKHPGEIKIATISAEIRKILRVNVQILVLTPERLERLKKDDPVFYYSLVFGSIVLYGEAVE